MNNVIRAEALKHKGRFYQHLLWILPFLAVTLSLVLMSGINLVSGAINWFYTLLYPGVITILIAFSMGMDREKNRHGLMSVFINREELWLGKIIYLLLCSLFSSMIFFALLQLLRLVFPTTIPLLNIFISCLILWITFLWQIPLWMWTTEIIGPYPSILLGLVLNLGMSIIFSASRLWWLPFAIPARLMCPVVGIYPNGLWIEANSPLLDPGVILPGLLISLLMFAFLTMMTWIWFSKREM
ncbi:MAG: lantibiotic immunity ABC transporter MutE/EpiE family permease subunit [Tissierellia bacterium]|nr:lantibiotic immunity ABC transporter MutE/EpiE family permease subunit [Tissierellia bacterium]